MKSDVYKADAKLAVFGITEYEAQGEKKSFWTQIGRAFVNRDGSIQVRLNYMPAAGQQIQIRVQEPREDNQSRGSKRDDIPF